MQKRPQQYIRNPELRRCEFYRYLDQQWIDIFRTKGILRIHAITKYHTIGDIREDRSEGIVSTIIDGDGFLTGEQAKEALGVNVKSVTFQPGWKGHISHNLYLPNGFMICVSRTLGSHLKNRFGVNAYFTIVDVDLFENLVANSIGDQVDLEIIDFGRVEYVCKKELAFKVTQLAIPGGIRKPDLDDYFKKERSYLVEAECRFLFLTDSDNLPEYVEVQLNPADIMKCCKFN